MAVGELIYDAGQVSQAIQTLLTTLSSDYPIKSGKTKVNLRFCEVKKAETALSVVKQKGVYTIEYSTINAAARGIGMALSGVVGDGATPFKALGIMLDCSRDKVFTVEHLKSWFRQLSLLGYNLVMLYCEDTYQLPGEPFFGYMRGGYSLAELQEADAYASKLGIELVGCLELLGHMEQMLHWPKVYSEITDTRSVLLANCEKTYELMDKAIEFWSKALKSRRLHLGMDETHDLGRGRYLDKFGFTPPVELFNQHLAKLTDLCAKHQVKPEIWSDMYFRLNNDRMEYYDLDNPISDEVKAMIPQGVRQWYWDYYHDDVVSYKKMITRHKELGRPVSMASGIWTWGRMWCDHYNTKRSVIPCIQACREEKIEELVFTMWGDDGAFCLFDSALSDLTWAADLAFGGDDAKPEAAKKMAGTVCKRNYDLDLELGLAEMPLGIAENQWVYFNFCAFLWDNPLQALWYRGMALSDLKTWYEQLLGRLKKMLKAIKRDRNFWASTDLLAYHALLEVLIAKLELRPVLEKAYAERDKKMLKKLAEKVIPNLQEQLFEFQVLFRDEWLSGAKPYGLEVIVARNGGLSAQYTELQLRLLDLLNGTIDRIDELEDIPDIKQGYSLFSYAQVATSAVVNRW